MNSLQRRIERAEDSLSMSERLIVCNVVWFGGEPVPPEQRRDNIITRYVAYETIQAQREGTGQT